MILLNEENLKQKWKISDEIYDESVISSFIEDMRKFEVKT